MMNAVWSYFFPSINEDKEAHQNSGITEKTNSTVISLTTAKCNDKDYKIPTQVYDSDSNSEEEDVNKNPEKLCEV